jgi:MoaA/NifB/PqqE/SkfB family radical SAM enzyme
MATPERQTIDRGWFYVVEPDGGRWAPVDARILAADGRVLTRRLHGCRARVALSDESGAGISRVARLRAATAVGRALESLGDGTARHVHVRLGPAGTHADLTPADEGHEVLHLDGPAVASAPSHHPLEAQVLGLLGTGAGHTAPPPPGVLPDRPVPRVLFFESLMNTDMPHNDREISQGVLHMASPLSTMDTEVVLANVKMPIQGAEREAWGLESLEAALAQGPVGLVCITLLEGYFDPVLRLIGELRRLGCRARIAVGGVMPTLTPEHVAAHLPDVSFVCRGAGEVFVQQLAAVVGDTDIDTPLDAGQLGALLRMNGLIALDHDHVVMSDSARTVQVDDLDRMPLDLQHLQARHIEGGIEISTSRGCIHKCTFCSIIGREAYEARSAGGVLDLLRQYEIRFAELFGDRVPHNAYRVHISDDDFACDKHRAAAFFRALPETRFRMSSVQVSVADLCRHDGTRLLEEVDPVLFDALSPTLFADAHRNIPERDFVADHKSRNWSSFLQLGVETFSRRELLRLGKGYKIGHIRAVATVLDQRHIHMDAYFIQSNSDTTLLDLVESAEELTRLKLRHPRHFHLRFPVVPHLVSYFPAATHRRKVRQGKADTMKLRGLAAVPGFGELDYPFVDHDLPGDPWVAAAVDQGFLTDEALYAGSLERLRAIVQTRHEHIEPSEERREGERMLRRLDDARRRLVFDLLRQARHGGQGRPDAEWPGPPPEAAHALGTAEALLGPKDTWLPAFARFASQETPRLVVIPTWQCELRCRYCYIPKQDGRVMTPEILERSIDLLLSSDRPELILQFFGGEALLEWDLVQRAVAYGAGQAKRLGRRLQFILSSNGYSLTAEKLAWLNDYDVKLELSLDGDTDTQNRFRRALKRGEDSYDNGIAPRAQVILDSGLPYDVIMVVHPANVDAMPANFFHVAGLGFERIQINFALGPKWTPEQKACFASGLHEIGVELRRRWQAGERLMMVNLEGKPMPIRLNGEVTVDWDGTVYGGNAFLHETEHKDKFVVGHLDEARCFDRYWMDSPTNDFLLKWSYKADITKNNLAVGRIMTSFMGWMQKQPIGPVAPARAPDAPWAQVPAE